MKISVQQVKGGSGEPYEVLFSCNAGQGWSRWSSPEAPGVGSSYDVELDVDDSIELGRNAVFSEEGSSGVAIDANGVILVGVVESRDEDGMTYLRLASDCLLMIESDDDLPTGRCIRLSLSSNALELIPFG